MKTAILLGASGLIGGYCLTRLLEHASYGKIVALGRRTLPVQHKKLETHSVDFDRLDEYVEKIQGDDLFCCLGTTIKKAGSAEAFRRVDYEYPLKIAELALKQGITHYSLISSVGASARSKTLYSRVKGEVEEALISLNFPSLHIFQPSLLLDDRDEQRIGEEIGKRAAGIMSLVMHGPLKKYRPIEGVAVAQAMVTTAQNPASGYRIFPSDEIQSIYQS